MNDQAEGLSREEVLFERDAAQGGHERNQEQKHDHQPRINSEHPRHQITRKRWGSEEAPCHQISTEGKKTIHGQITDPVPDQARDGIHHIGHFPKSQGIAMAEKYKKGQHHPDEVEVVVCAAAQIF